MNKRQLKKLSTKLKVVQEPHRLAIINELVNGPQMVKYLKVKLKIEATLLSHHLKILRDMDYIVQQPAGKSRKYALTPLCPSLEDLAMV